jgi:hypothetical protein
MMGYDMLIREKKHTKRKRIQTRWKENDRCFDRIEKRKGT